MHRDKLRIVTGGFKTVKFYKDGELVKEESYPIPVGQKMFDDRNEWVKVKGQTTD